MAPQEPAHLAQKKMWLMAARWMIIHPSYIPTASYTFIRASYAASYKSLACRWRGWNRMPPATIPLSKQEKGRKRAEDWRAAQREQNLNFDKEQAEAL